MHLRCSAMQLKRAATFVAFLAFDNHRGPAIFAVAFCLEAASGAAISSLYCYSLYTDPNGDN